MKQKPIEDDSFDAFVEAADHPPYTTRADGAPPADAYTALALQAQDEGWQQIAAGLGSKEKRGNVLVGRRIQGAREARVVAVGWGASGGKKGIALWLFHNGTLLHNKFHPFEEAVNQGNAFIDGGKAGDQAKAEIHVDEVDVPDDAVAARHLAEYALNNVRRTVNRTQNGRFFITVYVDSTKAIDLFKPCNTCNGFSVMEARNAAKRYVTLLQGWKRL